MQINFALYIYIVFHIVSTRIKATVTLTAPSSPPCFGQTYKLTCTHPVLDGGILLRWERNGTGFTPQADDTSGNTTTTTLTINVTREEFENKVYTYRCITFDSNVGFINDPNKAISNEVTVDPPGEYRYIYIHTYVCSVAEYSLLFILYIILCLGVQYIAT